MIANTRIPATLLILILHFIITSLVYPEIKKKILKDGTIEYYSEEKKDIDQHKRALSKSPYNKLINRISKKEGADPYLIKCIIKIESNFNPDAVSKAGAMGLMQIMQEVARYYDVKDPLNPEENLKAGIKHLKSIIVYFNNDIPLSLAAYHAGIGRVKKAMKIPPISSTVDYVDKVMLLYSGKRMNEIRTKVKSLYKRIEKDGTIAISDK
ncbi:MAG: lytic transglycosylase domain-containing protein [Spirochaetota bacterium]|nr:lytic transglycosylase domain-containing protein [Spirochaetota bacterium]